MKISKLTMEMLDYIAKNGDQDELNIVLKTKNGNKSAKLSKVFNNESDFSLELELLD